MFEIRMHLPPLETRVMLYNKKWGACVGRLVDITDAPVFVTDDDDWDVNPTHWDFVSKNDLDKQKSI